MTDRLPPLTALRAFEAAARHMSFANAAAELNVTPAALSFQIKSLEDHLGGQVFRRMNRAVELTEVGQMLVPGTREGFDALMTTWRSARRFLDQTHITVTAGPAFTAKWLAPRMFDFAQAHPEIELRFAAALRIMDFDRDDVDVAIRYSAASTDPTVFSKFIMNDYYVPMCTPEVAKTLTSPGQLISEPLIYADDTTFLNPPCDWAAWFKVAKIDSAPPSGSHFSQSDHALDAAMGGGGIVLGRTILAQKALSEGRLVTPFKVALKSEEHAQFLCPKGAETRPHIAAFLIWIEQEATKFTETIRGFEIVNAADVPA